MWTAFFMLASSRMFNVIIPVSSGMLGLELYKKWRNFIILTKFLILFVSVFKKLIIVPFWILSLILIHLLIIIEPY